MANMDLLLWNGATAGMLGAVFVNIIAASNKILMFVRGEDTTCLYRTKLRILAETILFITVFIVIEMVSEDPLEALFIMTMFSVLFGIGVCDSYYKIIPNEYIIVIAATAALMLISGSSPVSIVNALAGGIAGGLIFIYPYIKTRTCGGGDVKLCAAAGLTVGLGGMLAAIASMGIILFLYTLYKLIRSKTVVLSNMVPLGPVLSTCIFIQIILLDIIPGYASF